MVRIWWIINGLTPSHRHRINIFQGMFLLPQDLSYLSSWDSGSQLS
jgi:hypothetical protein